jgi:hypothetical protein
MEASELLGGGGVETEEVPIPRLGISVTVRGMTRMEALLVGKQDGPEKIEPLALHYAVVDPKLTLKQAEEWMRTAPSTEVGAVVRTINRLSGGGDRADKEVAKSVPGEEQPPAV